jgi:hypothetical protein
MVQLLVVSLDVLTMVGAHLMSGHHTSCVIRAIAAPGPHGLSSWGAS